MFFTGLIVLSGCKSNQAALGIEPVKLNITDKSTIVCFGDSLTSGHGADNINNSFSMVMQEK
jgi:lysophospholipase L1-like esterase